MQVTLWTAQSSEDAFGERQERGQRGAIAG